MKKRSTKLTLKSLGIVVRPGLVLDDRYANSRTCFRVVDTTDILGYCFIGDGYRSPVRIAPIYRAMVYVRPMRRPLRDMYESHVMGEYLNGYPEDSEDWISNYAAHAALLSVQAVKHGDLVRHGKRKRKL